jgi:hypothetical protein
MFFLIDTKNRRIHEMVSSVHEIPLYTHEMTFWVFSDFAPLIRFLQNVCKN